MLFHYYGERWISFLETLGVEPVVSSPTNSRMIGEGASYADNETCFPVKVFVGHILALKESVDYMLIPRLISQGNGTSACPKYLGLPDIARSLNSYMHKSSRIPEILSPRIDMNDRRRRWLGDWYDMARSIGFGRRSSAEAIKQLPGKAACGGAEAMLAEKKTGALKVGIIGHRYSIDDTMISLDITSMIRRLGAETITVEEVPRRHILHETRLLSRKINWSFENDFAGSALYWSKNDQVSGIIYALSFPCGPGSMISSFLEDRFRHEASFPFMPVILDEHSAETGLLTRIEAFGDMLERKTSR